MGSTWSCPIRVPCTLYGVLFQNSGRNFIYTFRMCYRVLVEYMDMAVPYNYCLLEVFSYACPAAFAIVVTPNV
jgi:hypothetical protein